MGKAEETKQYIIEKSASLFNKKGYAGTSISDLTEALGLTKGAIYGNFKNKDEIALEALVYNFDQISVRISKIVRAIDNCCDKLIAFAKFYRDNFDTIAEDGGCPILNGAIDSDDGNPLIREKVLSLLNYWRTNLEQILQRGIDKKEIMKNTNIKKTAALFIMLIEGGFMLSKITGDSMHLETAVTHLTEYVDQKLRK